MALERRVSQHGSSPLLTWYDLDAGYRIELSGRTFANWVDKSANLLVYQWGVELGKKLALQIAPAVGGDSAALEAQDASTRGLIGRYRALRYGA